MSQGIVATGEWSSKREILHLHSGTTCHSAQRLQSVDQSARSGHRVAMLDGYKLAVYDRRPFTSLMSTGSRLSAHHIVPEMSQFCDTV